MKRLKRISLLTVFLIFCWLFLVNIVRKERWWMYKPTIQSDIAGYYMYIQAAFVNDDMKLQYFKEELMANPSQYRPEKTKDGKRYIKYTCGMSYFYLPIFYITRMYTARSGIYESDGFSMPFQRSMQYVGVLYLLPALLAMGKYLRRFASGISAGITIFLLLFSTNLYYYLTGEAAFPHSINFMLCALLIFFSYSYSDHKKTIYLLGIAITISLLTLIRPINVLLILVPIFANTQNKRELFLQIKSFFKPINLFYSIGAAFIIFLPQFIYWKYATGHFIFYSYENEGFHFLDPHVFDGLFSFRKGLFIYTPILLLFIPGLILRFKKHKQEMMFIFLFFLLYAYVTFSWWNWYYGGGFGSRPLIDIYPLLAIPLVIFIDVIIHSKWIVKFFVSVFIIGCLILNLFQTKQYKGNTMHWSNMDWHSYKAIFGKEVLTAEERKVLEKYWATNYEELPMHKTRGE